MIFRRTGSLWRALLPLVLLIAGAAVVRGQQHWWEKIMPSFSSAPTHSSSKLYTEDVGLNTVNGYVAATGDFNSDKYTDLFVVSASGSGYLMQVYLFYPDEFNFKALDDAAMSASSILNVAPGDFNYDGTLDCVVTGERDGSLFMDLYVGDNQKLKLETKIADDTESPVDQVLVMDANNDLRPDLFGVSKASGKRVVWLNSASSPGIEWTVQEFASNAPDLNPIASPHSNAVVDINGDCLADLLIVSMDPDTKVKSLEIWLNQKKNGYELDQVFELVPGAGQITYADYNADGALDISFPVCYPSKTCATENSVHIIYNEQMEVCSGLWSTNCRSPSNLCDNTEYTLPDMDNSTPSKDVVIVDGFSQGDSAEQTGVLWADDSLVPLTVRTGDYNIDGYEDLLVPLHTDAGAHVVQLWKNVPCDDDSDCSPDAIDADRRTFQRVTSGVSSLEKLTNAYTAFFFDIGELGLFDIFVFTDDSIGAGGGRKNIKALYNNFFNDAYFIKMLGLNGRCPSWCKDGGSKFPTPKPYGVNHPGAVFKFTVTDASGKKRGAVGPQLSQSAYLALQTPYAFLGLGRTSNYIDSMFYGITLNDSVHYHQYQGVIPNSQVAAFPYPTDKPASWTMEMYISPSGILFWVIVLCVVVCLTFAIFIGYFTYRERQQDKEEEREKGFSFNPL
eukprot:TRINITY_DN1035_c0_g1_i1.p1 TRINITY_DN1035_c0_g1~~TRINITY_DN1035_c0_g1_i1.p1  ORF type:complete len:675 (-),score=195.64 TRINITY_DN1035_c0_g1_i1:406-2430(-)